MYLFRIKNNIPRILIMILILNILFLYSACSGINNDTNIEVATAAGFDGVTRIGSSTIYNLDVVNNGSGFKGEAQVEIFTDPNRKIIYSKTFEIPQNSTKSISLTVPTLTANKESIIRIVKNNKPIYESKYSFNKIIPPNYPVIGVLSDSKGFLSYLNNAVIKGSSTIPQEKLNVLMASGKPIPYDIQSQITIIDFDSSSFPDDEAVLDTLDYIVIDDFDTSLLTSSQLKALDVWLKNNILIISTGNSWKKVYNGLPNDYKVLSIEEVSEKSAPKIISQLGEWPLPADSKFEFAIGNVNTSQREDIFSLSYSDEDNLQLIGYEDFLDEADTSPSILLKKIQNGFVITTAFDFSKEPFASWSGRVNFFKNLISQYNRNNLTISLTSKSSSYLFQPVVIDNNYNFRHLTTQIPDEKKPPLLFIGITLLIYIVASGPILYLILKKKNKREYMWFMLPLVAVVFMGIIYIAGFKTRYSSAVINNISYVELDKNNNTAYTYTSFSVFNNKKGTLEIEYSDSDNIFYDMLNNSYDYDYRYGRYGYNNEQNQGKVTAKKTIGNPAKYEIYDVPMWTPVSMEAYKEQPFNITLIKDFSLNNNALSFVIDNTSEYDFLDSFIKFGNNLFETGDILSGETKEYTLPISQAINMLDMFLDMRYGRPYYDDRSKQPKNFLELQQKRELINTLFNRFNYAQPQNSIDFYAFNKQSIEYDFLANNKKPITFNTNIIHYQYDISFKKGTKVEIPSGILVPVLNYNFEESKEKDKEPPVYYVDNNLGIRVNNIGNADFILHLPENIDYSKLGIQFDSYVPLYVKYQQEDMKQNNNNYQIKILENTYNYYIYDYSIEDWSQIKKESILTHDLKKYIGNNNDMLIRISIENLATYDKYTDNFAYESETLLLPQITVEGVAK